MWDAAQICRVTQVEKFMDLPIDTPELLRETINLIFDKATMEQTFCPMYGESDLEAARRTSCRTAAVHLLLTARALRVHALAQTHPHFWGLALFS